MHYKTNFLFLDKVESTISFTKDYLNKNNLEENIVVIAETQTKGVGKFNNVWVSPKGNLYLTAAFKPFYSYSWSSIEDINIFNLLVSFSLLQVIKNILKTQNNNIFCKWPNDIIINDAKVSGILLENISNAKEEALLTSVGVNINVAPNLNNNYNSISLNSIEKTTIRPADFGKTLIENIYNNITKLTKTEIINNWLYYAYKLNQNITVKLGNTIKSGIFRGVNSIGLLLEVNNSIETISVGEIY